MKKLCLIGISVLLALPYLQAQQLPLLNQSQTNPFLYNPALAGSENHAIIYLTRRQQLAGNDTPALTYFSFNTPVAGDGGFGFNFFNSSQDTSSQSLALISFGRAVPLAEDELFYFGIAGGFGLDRYDLVRIDNPAIPGLQSAVESNAYFNGQLGAHYRKKGFNVGLVLPSLIKSDTTNRDFNSHRFSPFRNLYLNASYAIPLMEEQLTFEPRVTYRINKDIPSQIEAVGVLHYQEQAWVGGGYRQDYGGLLLAGIMIQDLVSVGYSYEFKSSQKFGPFKPNHEVHIGVRIGPTRIPPKKGFDRVKEKEPGGSQKPRYYYEPKKKNKGD
ncbi:MAG: PorP/SprF family type IX secretion system membrane protein [Cyclobacteriaceae bacterium]